MNDRDIEEIVVGEAVLTACENSELAEENNLQAVALAMAAYARTYNIPDKAVEDMVARAIAIMGNIKKTQ
ncbi:MAG: hypothetical protein CML67_07830 [Rhodobacteraceae bacterium]|nr:hypothetical protein [Paracoccaceae bacterium]